MKLLVGLGNPGDKYENTKHNVGFLLLDELTSNYGFEDFNYDKKFSAFLSKGMILGENIIAIKPQTFMNLSGDSVIKVVSYYKIGIDDILVIHDDIDFDIGQIKIRKSKGSGGHNGIKDIKRKLSAESLWRLKIGVGRPINKSDVVDYVLTRLSKVKQKQIFDRIDEVIRLLELWIQAKV